jgi:hypothetical protein
MNSSKKHERTEGPWHLKKRGWMGGGPYVIGKSQRVVADCGLDGEDGTYRRIENVANAKFISKAPEMLNLLNEARLLLEQNDSMGRKEWIQRYESLLSKVRETSN